jgi:hypothetical protein
VVVRDYQPVLQDFSQPELSFEAFGSAAMRRTIFAWGPTVRRDVPPLLL